MGDWRFLYPYICPVKQYKLKREIMKNLIQSGIIVIIMLFALSSTAQNFTQTIKGQIVDKETQAPLPFVNVIIMNADLVKAVKTDLDGYYKIDEVAIGRVTLEANFEGFESKVYRNIELSSSKELILNIEMEESTVKIDAVVIVAKDVKDRPLNKTSTVSARMFSVEETKRYAGSNNDVSRMAMNFAGVYSSNNAINDIVIRGNSPGGVLWRLEGVDIPNPNHFGDGGATGGPVSMLNNNVLANSDFMTAAFPSEYGNALSGVFDLKMRNGNDEKHEFLGQMGINGFELGAEGPINRKKHSSYLVNYRYSTLGILQAMGVNLGTGIATPYFQDLTFKLNFPDNKFGTVSVFGLGGINNISLLDSEKDSTELIEEAEFFTGNFDTDIISENAMGVIGLTHKYLLSKSAYSKLTFAASSARNKGSEDSLSTVDGANIPRYRQNFNRTKYTTSLYLNKKFNAGNTVRIGSYAHYLSFNMTDSIYNAAFNQFETVIDYDGSTVLIQPYMQWQHKFNDKITLNTGLHYEYLTLNNSSSIEPRLGMKWAFTPKQSLNFGYGLHSQMAPVNFYYRQVLQADGTYTTPNTELDFTKSRHFVIGYDFLLSETIRLKAETYYQHITNAVIEAESSSYSLLNHSSITATIPDSVTNKGTGFNYGVEITLEKFLDKGFYFLTTASLFESKYTGSDDVERSTVFDGGYVFNLLSGKEFELGKNKIKSKKRKMLKVDAKFNIAGGQRYTPIDIERSALSGITQYEDQNAFCEQFDDYFRFDLRAGFKLTGKKATQEWIIEVQNVTNKKNPLYKSYNITTGEVETINQLGLLPLLQYRITF